MIEEQGEIATASKSSELADRSTPFIRKEWYVAAMGGEVSRKPISRTILGEDIVFYRKQDGTAVALQNRCPHRSFPLSLGQVDGDKIVCGYHGIQFHSDGKCAFVPSTGTAPGALRIESYPLKEVGPFIWIWMGGSECLDESLFVDQPYFSEGWRWVHGYLHMKANYLGLHENLMDTSHFPFVHGAALAQPEHAEVKQKIYIDGDAVVLEILHKRTPIFSQKLQRIVGGSSEVDRLGYAKVRGPAGNFGHLKFTNPGNENEFYTDYLLHLITPESVHSTHYFWALVRNVLTDDEDIQKDIYQFAKTAFMQDVVALEEVENLLARDHRPSFREKLIASDVGGVQVLRLLARLASEERTGARALRS